MLREGQNIRRTILPPPFRVELLNVWIVAEQQGQLHYVRLLQIVESLSHQAEHQRSIDLNLIYRCLPQYQSGRSLDQTNYSADISSTTGRSILTYDQLRDKSISTEAHDFRSSDREGCPKHRYIYFSMTRARQTNISPQSSLFHFKTKTASGRDYEQLIGRVLCFNLPAARLTTVLNSNSNSNSERFRNLSGAVDGALLFQVDIKSDRHSFLGSGSAQAINSSMRNTLPADTPFAGKPLRIPSQPPIW